MPQARLPDINTAFNYYRGKAVTSWLGKNWSAAIGSLYAFNGCLPKDYRVKISSKEYNDKTRQDIQVYCGHCNKEFNHYDITPYTMLLPMLLQHLAGSEYIKVWRCSECNKTNKLETTRMVQKVLAKPYFLQVVPEPPNRSDGLIDRTNFDKKFGSWFWSFLDELETQAAKFRDDNWQKKDAFFDIDSDIPEDGQEG